MNMPKGNPVASTHKICFYLETEHGINKEFRKQVFKMNSSLGSFLSHYIWDERASVPFSSKKNNNRDCGIFSIANAPELAFKGDPGTARCVSTECRCFPVYIALRYLYGPVKLDWFPYYRYFQQRIEKIRGKTHSTNSRCAACKLNTVDTVCRRKGSYRFKTAFPEPYPLQKRSLSAKNNQTQRQ